MWPVDILLLRGSGDCRQQYRIINAGRRHGEFQIFYSPVQIYDHKNPFLMKRNEENEQNIM